jgi:hypothetical protein
MKHFRGLDGAARGIRTPDPLITNEVLYQLSYCGIGFALDPYPSRRGPSTRNLPANHQTPVLGIDVHGSAGALASPFCKSSMEMLSGERMNAMRPSRGGRLIVTPAAIRLAQ